MIVTPVPVILAPPFTVKSPLVDGVNTGIEGHLGTCVKFHPTAVDPRINCDLRLRREIMPVATRVERYRKLGIGVFDRQNAGHDSGGRGYCRTARYPTYDPDRQGG